MTRCSHTPSPRISIKWMQYLMRVCTVSRKSVKHSKVSSSSTEAPASSNTKMQNMNQQMSDTNTINSNRRMRR